MTGGRPRRLSAELDLGAIDTGHARRDVPSRFRPTNRATSAQGQTRRISLWETVSNHEGLAIGESSAGLVLNIVEGMRDPASTRFAAVTGVVVLLYSSQRVFASRYCSGTQSSSASQVPNGASPRS